MKTKPLNFREAPMLMRRIIIMVNHQFRAIVFLSTFDG